MNSYDTEVVQIKDCIDVKEQNFIEKYVTNSNFPWGFYSGTVLEKDVGYANKCIVKKGINPPQFSSVVLLNDNPNIIFFQSIFNFIASRYSNHIHILKCKFNLLTKRDSNEFHYPHADVDNFDEEVKSAVYYVNNSDGDTYLFNEFAPTIDNNVSIYKTFSPVKGSILIFDSRRFHASSSPVINEKRIVLNIVFRIPKE